MKDWELFEESCLRYLQGFKLIKDHDFIFTKSGGSDSTHSDILAKCSCCPKRELYIECKMKESQTSQFVVKEEGGKFVFSNLNINTNNRYSSAIINHLNSEFDLYIDAKKRCLEVKISSDLAFKWIKNTLKSKKVSYIISGDFDKKYIIDINDISNHFTVKTKLRRKKSGTHALSKEDILYFRNLGVNKGQINEINITDSKTYIDTDLYERIYNLYDKSKYHISKTDSSKLYKVTKKSNTNNMTILFELKLINI